MPATQCIVCKWLLCPFFRWLNDFSLPTHTHSLCSWQILEFRHLIGNAVATEKQEGITMVTKHEWASILNLDSFLYVVYGGKFHVVEFWNSTLTLEVIHCVYLSCACRMNLESKRKNIYSMSFMDCIFIILIWWSSLSTGMCPKISSALIAPNPM